MSSAPDQSVAGMLGPNPDDVSYPLRADSWGNQLVNENGPRYMEMARRGQIYNAGSTTALAIPIFSTNTNSPTLFNTNASKSLIVVLRVNLACAASAGTVAYGLGLAMARIQSDEVLTGLGFAVFTNIAPWSMRDLSSDTTTKYAQAVTYTTTSSANVYWAGISKATIGTATAITLGSTVLDTEGAVVLWPGMACSLVSSVASVDTFMPTFVYAKLPLPLNQ